MAEELVSGREDDGGQVPRFQGFHLGLAALLPRVIAGEKEALAGGPSGRARTRPREKHVIPSYWSVKK
jgi:hypothetical protein